MKNHRALAEGEQPAADIFRLGCEYGYSPRMLRYYGRRIGVQKRRTGFGKEGHSVWSRNLEAACRNGRGENHHNGAAENRMNGAEVNGAEMTNGEATNGAGHDVVQESDACLVG